MVLLSWSGHRDELWNSISGNAVGKGVGPFNRMRISLTSFFSSSTPCSTASFMEPLTLSMLSLRRGSSPCWTFWRYLLFSKVASRICKEIPAWIQVVRVRATVISTPEYKGHLLSCSLIYDLSNAGYRTKATFRTIPNIIHLLCSFNWIMHNIKGILNTEQNKKRNMSNF